MRLLHGFDALVVLQLFDPMNLYQLVKTVLELLDEVSSIYHNQLALIRLADCSEFDLRLHLVGNWLIVRVTACLHTVIIGAVC